MKHAVLILCVVLSVGRAAAEDLYVAVAANFAAPMKLLAARFEAGSGHRLRVSIGSTGRLYAQIVNGAPFDLLLSADSATPARLVAEGRAGRETLATYAIGRLALWSADATLIDGTPAVLSEGRFAHLAVASARLSPYGAAAAEVMQALGVASALRSRLVAGESIGQAYQFVASGNAALGFVALSQVGREGSAPSGSMWRVPQSLHQPLRQDLVILSAGADKPAAHALIDYLRSDEARALIRDFGYALPQ